MYLPEVRLIILALLATFYMSAESTLDTLQELSLQADLKEVCGHCQQSPQTMQEAFDFQEKIQNKHTKEHLLSDQQEFFHEAAEQVEIKKRSERSYFLSPKILLNPFVFLHLTAFAIICVAKVLEKYDPL